MMDQQTMTYLEGLFDSKLAVLNTNIKDIDKKLDKNTALLKKGLTSVVEDLKSVKEEQQKQASSIEILQKEASNTDIIIYGLKQENYPDTVSKILSILETVGITITKYCIRNIRKLGKGNWNETPVLVSLSSGLLKSDIMKKKKDISENYQEEISIREALTKEVRERRKLLKEFSDQAKANNIKTYMRQDKLMIEGKAWTLEDLQKDIKKTFLNNNKRSREDDSPTGHQNKKTVHTPGRRNSIENFVQRGTPTTVSTKLNP